MKKLPKKLAEIINDVGLTQQQACWDCHGTPVILHKACELIAAKYNIVFDAPQFVETNAEKKIAVICVTGHMEDKTEWSIGEAMPSNFKNNYPFAMAEKRAKDRVILKLVGLHGHVYSEAEADEFGEERPKEEPTGGPQVSVHPLPPVETTPKTEEQKQYAKAVEKWTKGFNNCKAKIEVDEAIEQYKAWATKYNAPEADQAAMAEIYNARKLELAI